VILCLAANPSIDRLFEVDELRAGETHRPQEFVQAAGGKGLNAARAAAILGAQVQVVTILAGHAGRWLERELERAGIPVDAVWVEGESRSSLSVAHGDEGQLTEFYEHGVHVSPAAWAEFAATAGRCSAQAAWTTISGSLPPGAPADGYRGLELPCPTAVDTIEQRPAAPALVKLNAAEAAQLTGVDTSTVDGALAAAEALRAADGAGSVTRGPEGAVLVAPKVSVVGMLDAPGRYPVASGDSFLAGMVTARAGGADWADCMRLALGAAAANAAVPGAAHFQRADAERLAELAVVS
jgi:1-phosphofructokinase family hexose kinase